MRSFRKDWDDRETRGLLCIVVSGRDVRLTDVTGELTKTQFNPEGCVDRILICVSPMGVFTTFNILMLYGFELRESQIKFWE